MFALLFALLIIYLAFYPSIISPVFINYPPKMIANSIFLVLLSLMCLFTYCEAKYFVTSITAGEHAVGLYYQGDKLQGHEIFQDSHPEYLLKVSYQIYYHLHL